MPQLIVRGPSAANVVSVSARRAAAPVNVGGLAVVATSREQEWGAEDTRRVGTSPATASVGASRRLQPLGTSPCVDSFEILRVRVSPTEWLRTAAGRLCAQDGTPRPAGLDR